MTPAMGLIGDQDRDRAAASLRRHYVAGRLSVEEFGHRTELAIRARSDRDLRRALNDLPTTWRDLQDVVAPARDAVARAGMLLGLFTLWVFASVILLVAFAVATLVDGASTAEVVGFPLVWLAIGYGLWRVWQRGPARRV
jgi:hypothetical protein